jgi:hypothetical protein
MSMLRWPTPTRLLVAGAELRLGRVLSLPNAEDQSLTYQPTHSPTRLTTALPRLATTKVSRTCGFPLLG